MVVLAFAAACGSKSPAPAEPDPSTEQTEGGPDEETGVTDENGVPVEVPEGGFVAEECDQYCADGCPEVEEYDLCMEDCGCTTEETDD